MDNLSMESRLEPVLFFDAAALGGFVVHNVWTLIALISAAVGFWGRRLLPTSPSNNSSKHHHHDPSSNPFSTTSRRPVHPPPHADHDDDSSPTTTTITTTTTPIPSDPAPMIPMTTSACVVAGCVDEYSSCRKFTVSYYRDEVEREQEDEEEEEIGGGDDEVVGGDEVVMRWRERKGEWGLENEVKMRMGDMGWYRFQDMSVLDGSVVRLWDGGKRRQGKFAPAVVADEYWRYS